MLTSNTFIFAVGQSLSRYIGGDEQRHGENFMIPTSGFHGIVCCVAIPVCRQAGFHRSVILCSIVESVIAVRL